MIKGMKKYINKKLLIIFSIIIGILLIIGIIIIIELNAEKNTDVSNTIHGIVINDETEFKTSFGQKKILEKGTNVYILEEINNNEQSKFYKVKVNNRVGKILTDNVGYFIYDDENNYALMSDVSEFNIEAQFYKAEDYELFLLENSINYVYIRAGGRGYGEKGVWYTDSYYKIFIEACEYLRVPYGFYYLDEALNAKEIDEEVKLMEKFVNENATSMCKLPLAIDLEYQEGSGRADNIWNKREELIAELMKKFKQANIETIIYTNYNRANKYLSNLDSKFWIAYYKEDEMIPEEWFFDTEECNVNEELKDKIIGWQFTETGAQKSGLNEKLDFSLVKNQLLKSIIKDK